MSQLVKSLTLSLLFFVTQYAHADTWQYVDYQSNFNPSSKNWLVAQFTEDPYPTDWELLSAKTDFSRASIIFSTPASELITNPLLPLLIKWKTKKIDVNVKFLYSYPTAAEANRLVNICYPPLKFEFIARSLPTPDEVGNLLMLSQCAHVHLAMGRYPRYLEKDSFLGIASLPLTISVDYYPPYAAADTLNIIGMDVNINISDMMPSEEGIQNLNYIQKLKKLSLSFTAPPQTSDFNMLRKLRSDISKSISWTHSQIDRTQLEALKSLQLSKFVVNASTLNYSGFRDTDIQSVASEIIIVKDQE